VQSLAAGQAAAGHDVHVAAVLDLGDAADLFFDPLEQAKVAIAPLRLAPRAYGEERRRLAALLHELAPSAVHTHGYRADVQGGAVARRLGLPAVATAHGFTGGGWKNRLYEALQVRAYRRADGVVAVSRPLAARLVRAGVVPERVHVVPNAAPPPSALLSRDAARRELGLAPDAFVVGWVGRISREKGPDVLLEAIAGLASDRVHAAVIGAGSQRAALEALAAERGVGDLLHCCGLVRDAGRLFRAFDCFVLSSRTEGTPMVLFEAMAAEVPIVATAVGGVPDVVSGEDALLVPSEDPAALAAGIRAVRADPGAARDRARRASARLQAERAVAPWVARYDAVYQAASANVKRRLRA